ncbi:MAG: glycosyltransferase family 9 protein [Phycisphaerae bacterium]|nr:glycosyltransferase family 9 protein [Phycisphaerae bacterium]
MSSVLPQTPPKRVLIVKPSALGDVAGALPVLRGLRRAYPDAHVAWLVSTACAPLLDGDSDINELILFDRKKLGHCWRSPEAMGSLFDFRKHLREANFDWVIDLQGLLRSAVFSRWTQAPLRAGFADAREGASMFYTHRIRVAAEHTIDRNILLARSLGIDARPEDLRLSVQPEAKTFAENLLRHVGASAGGVLVCVPPTRWETKLYPAAHWRRVVRRAAERMPVVLLGSPDESERRLCAEVAEGIEGVTDLAGQTTIPQMVGLIAASAGVVCCDSAAKFIATAVGVRSVVLIGPTRAERTGPYRKGRAIVAKVSCQGCLQKHCRHRTCMESISPEVVLEAIDAMIHAGVS